VYVNAGSANVVSSHISCADQVHARVAVGLLSRLAVGWSGAHQRPTCQSLLCVCVLS
jgi:hypothetical protein